MNSLPAIMAAFGLILSLSAAQNGNTFLPAGSEDIITEAPMETISLEASSVTITLDESGEDGYRWSAFILGGDSAEITDEGCSALLPSSASDDSEEIDGAHVFKLAAQKPGECIIRFALSDGREANVSREMILLVVVEDDLNIFTLDVTESGTFDGIVTEVNADERTAWVETERLGEVIAQFAEDAALPVPGEHIMLYTNGIMTLSLPGIVNAIAWSSIPSELAR